MFQRSKLFLLCVIATLAFTACDRLPHPGNTATPQQPTLTFTAAPTPVAVGRYVTYTWNSVGADTCISDNWTGTLPSSGSQRILADTIGTFTSTLTCTGSGGSVSKSTSVTVVAAGTLPITFSADPTSVAAGQSTTLTWAASGADACTASGAWSGPRSASGTQSVNVPSSGNNVYSLNCSSTLADGSAQVTVQGLTTTASLLANPTSVGIGQPVTLTWNSSNALSCTASGEWSGTLGSSGSQTVTLNSLGNHTFNLSCGSPGMSASTSVTVSAIAATSAITKFTAFPKTVIAGQTATLTWEAASANNCIASNGWTGTKATSGRQTITLSQPGISKFTINCYKTAGSDSKTIDINVVAAPAMPPATAYQITPNHAGHIQFSGALNYPATPTWAVTIPGTVSYALIAGGRVFITASISGDDASGQTGSRLYALNAQTGAILWGPVLVPSPAGLFSWSSATYENGKVFVAQGSGVLRSYDASTGAAGWSTQLPTQYNFRSPPTAFGGLVFIGGNGSDGTVYAVDETNGALAWTQNVTSGGVSSPSLSSSGLYVNFPCQSYAFAPDTGDPLWHNDAGCAGGMANTSPFENNIFYARGYLNQSPSEIHYFDANTGATLGTGNSDETPAITAGQAFVLNSRTLQGVDLATGNVTWSFTGDGQLATAPIVINDRVIVGSGSATGTIYAVDAATGVQVWSSTAGMPHGDYGLMNSINAGEGLLVSTMADRVVAWKLTP